MLHVYAPLNDGHFYVVQLLGLSDVSASTVTGQPSAVSKSMSATILSLHRQATQLRHDVDSLRRLHHSSVELVMASLNDVFHKLQVSILLLLGLQFD